MSRYKILIVFFIAFVIRQHKCCTQDTLYLQKYLEIVISNHPIMQRANLNDELSAAHLLKGKGALDPKVYSDFGQKQFDETDYFSVWQSEAKIPTALPIDFSLGYEKNDGAFLNSENTVPNNGLIYGTININILRGLLFDEQRYNIQLAEIKGSKSQIEKEILTREIVYQAILAYLDWTLATNTLDVNENYSDLIRDRHQDVVELYINGESPAIDTIESKLNINSAEKFLLESRNKLIKSKQHLSLFIWDDNSVPQELNINVRPMKLDELVLTLRELSAMTNPNFGTDPLVAKIDNERRTIELDAKLERENLKPQLNLKYNAILNLGKEGLTPSFSLNDYKYAVSFQFPLINRKTRGQLRLNELLAEQNELDKVQYLGKLRNKFNTLLSETVIQDKLITVIDQKLSNSQILYEAEKFKFDLGESSVFLLNSRERRLLEARTELIKSYHSLGRIFSEIYFLKMGQI